MKFKKINIKYLILIPIIFFVLFAPVSTYPDTGDLVKFEKAKKNFKKGFAFFNDMRYLAAVEFFRKALSVYPEYYTAREYLARSYRLSGFIDEALKEWEILSRSMSNSISIIDKINSIKYRESQDIFKANLFEFQFTGEYKPLDLGRYRFPKPIDLAIDREKNIYITSFTSGKLVKLDLNGKGIEIYSTGVDSRFYGVDYWDGRVVVSDFKGDSIHLLNTDLDLIGTIGSSGSGKGKFHGPEGISFDDKGNIYVVDSGNNRIQKFDKQGKFILAFGEKGEYDGQLKNPSHIVTHNNYEYITDTGNKRIVCFDDSGNFIKNIDVDGLKSPRGIEVNNDNLMISDENNGLLFFGLTQDKKVWFNSWNNNERSFANLISAEIDRDGTLYCLDYKYESLFVFTSLKSAYNNLDVEVMSVDLKNYPTVAFYLNIRNRNGSPVYGLKRKNFNVVEDGNHIQNFSSDYFKEIDRSVSLVLCVDRSSKVEGYHNDIPWVSDFVLKKMKKNDKIRLLNFNKDTWVGNDFDWSRRRTIKALRKRSYAKEKNIGKALYNALTSLLLKHSRRGVVLVSDGNLAPDSFGQYTPRNIIEYAKTHFIPIYFIVFKNKHNTLQRIAKDTGGNIYKANELDGMRKIYNDIKNSEEYRYLLIYSSIKMHQARGWWSDVKIRVTQKGQTGIEWGGYFVP